MLNTWAMVRQAGRAGGTATVIMSKNLTAIRPGRAPMLASGNSGPNKDADACHLHSTSGSLTFYELVAQQTSSAPLLP